MNSMELQYAEIPVQAESFREEIRDFLAREMPIVPPVVRSENWMSYDADFSRKLGESRLIGLTMPVELGGRGAGAFARYVVSEELLAAGAPVSAHWIADRQSAPLLLKFGTPEQQARYIPGICRGELFGCIGMSEPDAGSDLASIRTRAVRDGRKWRINGAKVWTTNAHRSHFIIILVRTSDEDSRHAGLSQFLVDLDTPGVTVRPIRDITGEEHFNEVLFEDVMLDENALVGREGQGWTQVMAELAFERSGPERFLSAYALLPIMIDHIRAEGEQSLGSFHIGRAVARLATLRQMSIAVASELEGDRQPVWAASCVKDLGTGFEQSLPEIAQILLDGAPVSGDRGDVLARLIQLAPSFSLRGGTREILRGIIATGLGVR